MCTSLGQVTSFLKLTETGPNSAAKNAVILISEAPQSIMRLVSQRYHFWAYQCVVSHHF